MIDGFLCDKCETIIEFEELGLLGSVEQECSPNTGMITLCKPCRNKRINELEAYGTTDDKAELELLNKAKKERP